MNYYLQLFREERAGLYKGYKYPNLIEAQKQSCLHVGYFMGMSEELMLAVFRGEEELSADEIRRVAGYSRIPYSVLTCPKVIMLDMGRVRHRKMVAEVDNLCSQLKCMAREGNQKTEKYLECADRKKQDFLRAAHNNKLSNIHYLGAKRQLSDYILSAKPELTKSGISTMKGGTT